MSLRDLPATVQAGHQGDVQRVCTHEAGGGTVSRTAPLDVVIVKQRVITRKCHP